MVTQNDILGVGFAFPFIFSGGPQASNRGVAKASGTDLIEMSIFQIISTLFGGRIMRRKWGSELRSLVFDPIQPEFRMIADHVIRDAIGRQEKRVILGPLEFDFSERAKGKVTIKGQYQVIKTQVIGNLVFPLFLPGVIGSPVTE